MLNQTQIVQGFNQNMPEEIYQENEIEEKQVPKEIRYLTTEELDKLKKARDPFATAPAIDEANVKKEKEYNELMQKIQKRIEALNKEEEAKRKKAEKEDKNYTTNQEEFDKKVYDEIDKILKGVSTNVSTNIVVESQTKDQS